MPSGSEELGPSTGGVTETVEAKMMERALNIEDTEDAMDDSIDELDDIAIGEVDDEEQAATFSEESPPSQVPVENDRVDDKTDPVSLYLRDIGSTPLLTREREVQLGMQMEEGQEEYIASVIAAPYTVRRVLDLAEEVKHNETPLSRVLMAGDDGEAFDEAAERRRFLKGVTVLRGLLRERILDKLPLLVLQGTEKDCPFRMEMDTLW